MKLRIQIKSSRCKLFDLFRGQYSHRGVKDILNERLLLIPLYDNHKANIILTHGENINLLFEVLSFESKSN